MPPIVLVELVVVIVTHSEDDVIQLEVGFPELASHREHQIVAGVLAFVCFHEGGKKKEI